MSILFRYSIDIVSIFGFGSRSEHAMPTHIGCGNASSLRLFLGPRSIWARVEQPFCGLKRTAGIADGFNFRVDSFLRLSGRMSQSTFSAQAPPGVSIEHHNALVRICTTWRSGDQTDAKLVSLGEESLRMLVSTQWAQERQLPNETVESLA